ncbi:MAG TPA: hypothetical protein VGR78_10780, partial [Verrucomicrobiae bacterium]|nr:hypothetical protein [Verrucomicrobiae bacterium]
MRTAFRSVDEYVQSLPEKRRTATTPLRRGGTPVDSVSALRRPEDLPVDVIAQVIAHTPVKACLARVENLQREAAKMTTRFLGLLFAVCSFAFADEPLQGAALLKSDLM